MFDGDDNWTYWARRALFLAGQVWGGAGFALVPHRDGVVHPALLRACRAYDPDYVVVFKRTIGEQEHFTPGTFIFTDACEQPLDPEARAARIAEIYEEQFDHGPGAMTARESIARACSPYRLHTEHQSDEVCDTLDSSTPEFPVADKVPGAHAGPVLHCPPSWGGLAGAAVASHAGVAAPPSPAASEPELETSVIWQLLYWLFGQPEPTLPSELLWSPNGVVAGAATETSKLAHERTMAGLTSVESAFTDGWPAVAVLGDGPEDFALVRLIQLTYGRSVWLPTIFGTDDAKLSYPMVTGLCDLATKAAMGKPRSLMLTSVSRPTGEVHGFEQRLRESEFLKNTGNRLGQDTFSSVAAPDLSWTRTGTKQLAVHEQFDDNLSIPTFPDESDAREMATALPAPSLDDHNLAAHPDLAWHIDITWPDEHHVRGRGVTGKPLFAAEANPRLTPARNNRTGVSYRSDRFDFVLAGIQRVNRLARPALRHLSLRAFIDAKAAEHRMTVRTSDPGQRTAQLSRMLGGRGQFAEFFGGPLLPALKMMMPSGNSIDKNFPDGEGVPLRGENVLNFSGMCSHSEFTDKAEVRKALDTGLRAGVLRRGLVLHCQLCQTRQLQTVEAVGQRWTCQRCHDTNDLDRHTWHHSSDEPVWFYGLHPVAQHLLEGHGDVPALLTRHLAKDANSTSPRYTDVMEIELLEDGKPTVEVDLVAYRGDSLHVAECKSSAVLGKTKRKDRAAEINKKCRAAALLQADVLVFATTAAEWRSGVANHIKGTVQSYVGWPEHGAPRLHLVTGLGTTAPQTEVVRLNSTDRS